MPDRATGPPELPCCGWIVMVLRPPRHAALAHELMAVLRAHDARGLAADVYLVARIPGLEARLAQLADAIGSTGGALFVADSRFVEHEIEGLGGTGA